MTTQEHAQLIADALHAVEADPHFAKGPKRFKAKVSRLHRHLHEAADAYSETLGIDVQPLTGGVIKP